MLFRIFTTTKKKGPPQSEITRRMPLVGRRRPALHGPHQPASALREPLGVRNGTRCATVTDQQGRYSGFLHVP